MIWPLLANRWLLGGLVAAVVAAGGAWMAYSAGYEAGATRVQTAWDKQAAATAQAHIAELHRAAARTGELAAKVEQLQRSHRNEIRRIERTHADLVDSLRYRPEARAGAGNVPTDTAAGAAGCTGAGLARPDAAFLAGFAADAARTQAALDACIAAYGALSGPPADAR